MSNFRFPESWNTDSEPETSESISYDINPTILGKPTPRPDTWWSYMLDPWAPPKPDTPVPPTRDAQASAPGEDPRPNLPSAPSGLPLAPTQYAQKGPIDDAAQADASLARPQGSKEPPPRRGTWADVEPPSNSPELETSFQDWQGRLVRLPDGSPIPDPYSENGYLMSPFGDLSDVAASGRKARAQAVDQMGISTTGAGYDYLRGLKGNVGQGGAFDYQRRRYPLGKDGFTQLRQFRDVSNFNVGLYCQQAGLGLPATLALAGAYAGLKSSNARSGGAARP